MASCNGGIQTLPLAVLAFVYQLPTSSSQFSIRQASQRVASRSILFTYLVRSSLSNIFLTHHNPVAQCFPPVSVYTLTVGGPYPPTPPWLVGLEGASRSPDSQDEESSSSWPSPQAPGSASSPPEIVGDGTSSQRPSAVEPYPASHPG